MNKENDSSNDGINNNNNNEKKENIEINRNKGWNK